MSDLDAATWDRLERLRRRDAAGVFAGTEPATGTDPTGSLTVQVDPTYRVASVAVLSSEGVRTPADLGAAFAAAYRDALNTKVARTSTPEPARHANGRPRAIATPIVAPAFSPDQLKRHQIRRESRDEPRRSPASRGQVVGRSGNDCVWVTLDVAVPFGPVDADPGWLANATPTNLASAIVEAFQNAYAERDS